MIKRMTIKDAAELVKDVAGCATTEKGTFHYAMARLVLFEALQLVSEGLEKDMFKWLAGAESDMMDGDTDGFIDSLDLASRAMGEHFTEQEAAAGDF